MQKGQTGILILVGILVIAGIAAGAYYLGRSTIQTKPQNPIMTSSPVIFNVSEFQDSGITIKEYTVSFARVGDKTLLRYKGKIYDQDDQYGNPQEIKLNSVDNYQWYGLVDSPIMNTQPTFAKDEFFSFKVFPDKRNFVFVMRWDRLPEERSGQPPKITQDFKVFFYDVTKGSKVTDTLSFVWPEDNGYPVPKIDKMSNDNRYVSFDMYGCWNCGGHQPEKLLLDVTTGISKRIGKVLEFEWQENGKYAYKEYIPKECPPGPGIDYGCFEEPNNLPLKQGQF